MYEELDDTGIIKLVLQGRQQAYAQLVVRYQQYVFTLVMRFVKDRETAEELAQDIFVKAYKYLADFKGNSKFSTWLYTIVNTTCLSHLRKKKDPSILLEQEQIEFASEQHNHKEDPSRLLEHRTQKQMMSSAIKYLAEGDAQIITLFYLAEQSTEEIGLIMGLEPNNVKVKLYRARQKLKEILETRFRNELV